MTREFTKTRAKLCYDMKHAFMMNLKTWIMMSHVWHSDEGSVISDTGMDKTSLDTSSGSLFVTQSGCPRHVGRNYVPLFGVAQSNVDLR